jgi:hypothetical protein
MADEQYAPQPPQGNQYQQTAYQPPVVPAPAGNETLTVGNWMVTILLTAIPIVGFIMVLIWAFGSTTPLAKKNWARASLIWMCIVIVFYIILLMAGVSILGLNQLSNL